MTDDDLLAVLRDAAAAVRRALDGLDDWGLAGTRSGQYRSDLAADEACLAVLDDAGLGWLSEESGVEHTDRAITVVVDPVDGSTNASRGIPWYATSLCAVDDDGPRAALVVNQASGRRYEAVRGGGATVDGRPVAPSTETELGRSVIGLSGYPNQYLGWKQYRALGAAALDLCAVADGMLDGYLDCSPSAHGSWDYAGGLLICREAGIEVVDAFDRELLDPGALRHGDRRTPVAGATPDLTAELVDARRRLRWPDDPDVAGLVATDRH
ncbi:inositol monophosphatase [Acidimicrobiia bacterium EGI L10123]|uniref:inositol monophosphatase family protein n=1 Tax=Salinilacustrithrix flava TaxID=2957203 RepID=UPI003D7C24A9|nr:inositol monophosphatase [Acidimicrobiia bacterium EGI L10123]